MGIQAGAELEIGSIVRAQLAAVRGTVGTFASGDHMVHGVLDMAQGFVSLVAHLASPRFSSGYDSVNTKDFSNMLVGIGWKLSLQETIVPLTVGGQTYLVYTDSDGTEHYYTNDNGTYIEKGENTRLTITGTSAEYTLSDEYGGRKIFTGGYPETTAWESGRRRTARWTAHRSNQGLRFLSAFFRA